MKNSSIHERMLPVKFHWQYFLSGMLVLFVGFFVTITNVIGLTVVIIGAIVYLKSFKLHGLSGNR